MRPDLKAEAERAAAASYGASHRFYYIHGQRLMVPGIAVAGLIGGYLAVHAIGWGPIVKYLAILGLGFGVVAVLAGLVIGSIGRGPRLPGGRRPPRLPPGV
jgi:hypothetical protein